MKNSIFLLFIVLFGNAIAQNPSPNIHCVSVGENGEVSITYSIIDGTQITQFSKYVYLVSNGVTYDEMGNNTDITQGSYIFPSNINGNTSSISIRLRAEYENLSGDNIVETVNASSIYLNITNQTNTSAVLNWNSLGYDVKGSEMESFKIYRKFKNSDNDWVYIGEVDNNTYTYSHNFGEVCYDTLMYKIEIDNTFACTSNSNIAEIIVGDDTSPEPPTIPYITVDLGDQMPVLNWVQSISDDTYGYIVCKGNPCITIDTVWGKDNTTYKCMSCDATKVNSLAVMAFDTCMNTSIKTDQHNNIVLKYTRPNCSVNLNLDWTFYNNIPGGPKFFKVMGSQNDGQFTEYSTLGSSQTSTTIILNPIIKTYCFYIYAESNTGIVSLSNLICTSQDQGRQVKFNYIRSVEVNDNNSSVKLSFYVDKSVVVDGYDLYRAEGEGEFFRIGKIPYQNKDSFSYTDKLSNPANKSIYRYYLYVPDECGIIYTQSNIVNTIKLHITESSNQKNILSWNDVIGWNCSSYDIYRVSDSDKEPELLGSSISGTYGYEDNISNLVSTSDRLYYYVTGRESGAAVDGQEAISKSSRGLIVKESLVFIPNTIIITDIANNRFAPVCSFIRDGSYKFKILSRNGTIVFESTKVNEPWNGKYKDEYLKPGVYVYYLEYVNSYGEKIQKGGTINYIN